MIMCLICACSSFFLMKLYISAFPGIDRLARNLFTLVELISCGFALFSPTPVLCSALFLTHTMLMDGDSIKVLQALPNLRCLRFIRGYNGEKMHFEGGGFQKLKSLRLAGLTELNTMIIDQGAIPLLEILEITCCKSLKEVPSGIQHLQNLKQLSFALMSDEFNERLSPNNGQDYWIVKHVPVLQYDSDRLMYFSSSLYWWYEK